MDFQKTLLLQQVQDTLVLRVLTVRGEQPCVYFLPLLYAGLHDLRLRGIRMRAQVTDQPQFQRMDAGDVTAVRQRHLLRRILRVHFLQLAVAHPGAGRQPGIQESLELRQAGVRLDAEQDGGQPRRRRLYIVQQQVFRVLRVLALVFAQEAADEYLAFPVGKAGQVGGPARVIRILQQAGRRSGYLKHIVMDDVAHEPDEHEVDGIA